ncbi:MAG: polyphenol oxidase family protein [Candidatus Methylacidiphilales bacterium]|nr:polyphenol oxidase family protein [Candidatus Methylacidiphilales bacterium]
MIRFPELDALPVDYAFTEREADVHPGMGEGPQTLARQGFSSPLWVQAEQVHGAESSVCGVIQADSVIPGVDGLITDVPNLTLIIRVADCAPVFLVDPVRKVVGLVHSGRRGTSLNIVPGAIARMVRNCGCDVADLHAVIGPCIRPPHYEVDFAAAIARQARDSGVPRVSDCGLNTAADLKRFYSYRVEQGQTGRHFAALRLRK